MTGMLQQDPANDIGDAIVERFAKELIESVCFVAPKTHIPA